MTLFSLFDVQIPFELNACTGAPCRPLCTLQPATCSVAFSLEHFAQDSEKRARTRSRTRVLAHAHWCSHMHTGAHTHTRACSQYTHAHTCTRAQMVISLSLGARVEVGLLRHVVALICIASRMALSLTFAPLVNTSLFSTPQNSLSFVLFKVPIPVGVRRCLAVSSTCIFLVITHVEHVSLAIFYYVHL
jgi:hypothetical protein